MKSLYQKLRCYLGFHEPDAQYKGPAWHIGCKHCGKEQFWG